MNWQISCSVYLSSVKLFAFKVAFTLIRRSVVLIHRMDYLKAPMTCCKTFTVKPGFK